jgi:ATP-binding cassette subfamily C protein
VPRRSVKPYLAYLVRAMGWKVGLALGLMVALSLAEGIGLLMLVPLLGLAGLDVQQGALAPIARGLAAGFAALGLPATLLAVLGAFVVIVSAQAQFARWQTLVNAELQEDLVASLRQRLYRAIVGTGWLFFSRRRAAELVHALTSEVERVRDATDSLLRLLATILVTLVYVAFALRLSPALGLVVLLCGGGLLMGLRGRRAAAWAAGEGVSRATSRLFTAITEHLGGLKTAKCYDAVDRHAAIFATLTEGLRGLQIAATRNRVAAKLGLDVGSVIVLSLIIYVSLAILRQPTAQVLLLLFLFARIIPRYTFILTCYHAFLHDAPAFAALTELHAECRAAAEPGTTHTQAVALRRALSLENVTFAYEAGAPVLHELDLTIPAGRITALVGPSGAGKSTVADLILGLLTPQTGRVLVDGTPLRPEHLPAWRDGIGYVAQDTYLFHDTVRANLLWARPTATEEDLRRAVDLAAADFLTRLPDGLDTLIGDRGIRLSGGERQRLALARALLRNPALLILDEATNALDAANEQRILGAIENLRGAMTILVISHRLATVRGADIIYVIEDGRLMEAGPWDSLVGQADGRFAALCRAQGTAVL